MSERDSSRPRFLLLFVDGVGLAPTGASNPLATAPMPAFRRLLGGRLTVESAQASARLLLRPLDATLGVAGLPQSATGQTTLLTGVNAARELGRHVSAFPGPRLAALLAANSVLAGAGALGRSALFANPFTPRYFAEVAARRRRLSATTLAALAGRTPLRDLSDLERGEAVSWDVCRDHFATHLDQPIALITAEEAGRQLARLAGQHDFTLWETFMTDLAGHARWGWTAEEALARLDGLLAGVLAARPEDLTVLLTSDHGNLEDATHRLHTRNPVPLLAVGPDAAAFAELDTLDEVTPCLLSRLAAAPA